MAKITTSDRSKRDTIVIKTKKPNAKNEAYTWWNADKNQISEQLLSTVSFLKDNQQYRYRQASIYARMYGNVPLNSWSGASFNRMAITNSLPVDRPTFNVVQSCVDTLVAKICQNRPKPIFLTDNSDYKQRNLAKQMNRFINGEFYQVKAYEKIEAIFKDASAAMGTGCLHVYETDDKRVGVERVMATELYVDNNDAFYGEPRSLYRLKLIDRSVLAELFPKDPSKIASAEAGYPDSSGESQRTASDQVMIAEAWHLPSSKEAKDGRHVITCTSGTLLDEEYTKQDFPFVFLHYSPRMVGFWAQSLTEQISGTQIEINKLLYTISKSISLVGVPRVFVEDGSKVVKAHLNDNIGAIVTYRGTKPEYEVAPCVPQELYAQLQRLIQYAYQQSGVSELSASSEKPAGLDSGEAIRSYEDIQTDRLATLAKRIDRLAIELSYKIIDCAKDIAERDGSYQTVYPDKDGTREIDLPASKLLDDPFVIQCYDESSLPRDPAGRKQAIVDDMQAGIISPQEGRRLLNYPDLEQEDKLAIAGEERILKQLDDIVEEGKYTPPDPYTPIQLAMEKVTQYYNLYVAAGLEESKAEMLRTYHSQLLALMQAAMPPAPQPMAGAPQAAPQPLPTNPMIQNTPVQ